MSGSTWRPSGSEALLTDLYQLTMAEAYFAEGMTDTAVFELAVRRLPARRGFLVAAGLEQVLDFLEGLRFDADDLAWLAANGRFAPDFLAKLAELRFTGSVHALPEGTPCFAREPIVRVTAPMPEAQLVESRLLQIVHLQTLLASKAARCVLAAGGRPLIDFGMRRAHGAEAALAASRAAYLAGFAGTATVSAAREFQLPASGTMAHSFIQAHLDEEQAFERFALARRAGPVILLLDTYDTEAAAHKVVRLAPRLAAEGVHIDGVRLDSGDLGEHARRVRAILDEGGLPTVRIVASGNLDEDKLAELVAQGAPIDSFGVGTILDTSADAPYLDCAYKLVEYAGRPCRKLSEGKVTYGGRKQVVRLTDETGGMIGDRVVLQGEDAGAGLLLPVMAHGHRLEPSPPLDAIRARTRGELPRLPAHLRRLATEPPYPVELAESVRGQR